MQKYRKWTDEATGVNPFIIADQKKFNIVYNIKTIIKSILISAILLAISPLLIIAFIVPFLSTVNQLVLILCGNIFSFDDNKFNNDLSKMNKKNTRIILSNYSSNLDPFYYIYKIPNVQFLVIHENESGEQSYTLTKGLNCIIRLLTQRQPFFSLSSSSQEKSLKNLILNNNPTSIVIFYEGIRTNALGTIKLSKTLSQKLYETQKDYMVCKISYIPRDELFFNLIRSPFLNFWRSLGSFEKRTLKIRSQITSISSIHNVNELKKDVDSFMTNNGSKLLDTNPKDYQNFIDFFFKTQKSDYVHDSK